MKQELEKALFDKHPAIFQQKDLSEMETCMCWGISTGDGWYQLLADLCDSLQLICDTFKVDIQATQVKEKFGTLRFYYQDNIQDPRIDRMVHALVNAAESESGYTCEDCGSSGETRGGGWRRTLCDKCAKEQGYSE